MITGCIRNVLASIGCATLLVVGSIVGWQYRAQIIGIFRSLAEREDVVATTDTLAVGFSSPEALRSARARQEQIARRSGPAYVVLTASEVAALIEAGLDPVARHSLDSLRVTLEPDHFVLEANIRLNIIGRDLLGPFAGMLNVREPLRVEGPVRFRSVGVLSWEPNVIVVRSFPFPSAVVPPFVNKLTGGRDGTVHIDIPSTVGDVRIRSSDVSLYRRSN